MEKQGERQFSINMDENMENEWQLRTVISDIDLLSDVLKKKIKNWNIDMKMCENEHGSIKKLCESKDRIDYYQNHMVIPLENWLKLRQKYMMNNQKLYYPQNAKFLIEGFNLMLKFVTTADYFINIYNKYSKNLEEEDLIIIENFVDITKNLIGCDTSPLAYHFLQEFKSLLNYIKQYDPTKYKNLYTAYRYLYTYCDR